ncbi:uncharacterized protein [Mytilus edulis]|uniref:uncharacterized protein n=1 Tax=Mytilus edulis TaxID=6550 RepID=UPI0039EF6971
MSRQVKPPSKLSDCFTGDEIDNIIDDATINIEQHESRDETPIIHDQCDGKTNNVSFKTNRANIWKKSIYSYFEHCSELKDGATIKIQCKGNNPDETIGVKFNFYKSGMVTIQGAKCKVFTSKYFETLKVIVNQNAANSEDECKQTHNDTITVKENMDIFDCPENSDYDETKPKVLDESTNDKTIIEMSEIANASSNDTNVSTPIVKKRVFLHENITPISSPKVKERLAEHQETLAVKLSCINTALINVDSAIQTITNLVSEVRAVAAKFSSDFGGQLTKNNKVFKELLDSLESKVKHSNQGVESLHVKANVTDNQLKKLTENQEGIMAKLDEISQQLLIKTSNEESSVDNISNTWENIEKHIDIKNTDSLNSKSKPMQQQENGQLTPKINKMPLKNNLDDKLLQCDNLLLSDSILKRITPSQFSPNETTKKRYIRGGANTCTQFINNNGENFRPKRVLIHIGARDVQKDGVNKNEFKLMFESIIKTWPTSDIYILPILYRKDIENLTIDEANDRIISVAHDYPSFNILKRFIPTDDMFFDYVHLNDSRGIPAIVKFLKRQMKIPFTQANTPPRISNKPSVYHGETKNYRQNKADINNNNQYSPPHRNPYYNNNTGQPLLRNPYNNNGQYQPPIENPNYNNSQYQQSRGKSQYQLPMENPNHNNSQYQQSIGNSQYQPPMENPNYNNNQYQQPLGNPPGPPINMPYFNPWLFKPWNMPPAMQRMDF